MGQVKFNLKDRAADVTTVNLIYRYSGKKLKMSTGIKIPPKHWNQNTQRVKELANYADYPGHNMKLQRMTRAVEDAYTHFQLRNEIPSVTQMRNHINLILNGGKSIEKSQPKTVVTYIHDYIEDAESKGKKKGTIQGFRQLKNVMTSFQGGKSYEFKDLDSDRMEQLTYHMINKYEYSTSQIEKIQRKLITIVNSARGKYEINDTFNHKSKPWKVKLNPNQESGKEIAFTIDELKAIEKAKLPEKYEGIRDRFLIGINVGQRYSDFKNFNIESTILIDGRLHWDIVQQKGSKPLKLLVNDTCKAILDKYDGYPPVYSLNDYNDGIKQVCKLAMINAKIITRKFNPQGEVISARKVQEKWELASSHDCRRTTATLLHDKGVPLMKIKQVTGHSKLKDLENYLKLNKDEVIEEILDIY